MSLADGVALLPALVKKFHDLHPDALVHLDAGYEPGLMKKLKDGDLDFAILENESIEDDISSETLGLSQLVFCAPDKPPYNSVPQPVKVKTLLEWPMIIYEWNSGRHMVGNRHFRERFGISLQQHNMVARFDTHEAMVNGAKAGLGWASVPECIYQGNRHFRDRYGVSLRDHNMVARFDTHESMMNGVRAGLGWASVPRCIARRYRHEPGVIWFDVDTDPMRYPVDIAWHSGRAIPPLALEFMDFIRENIPDGYFQSDE